MSSGLSTRDERASLEHQEMRAETPLAPPLPPQRGDVVARLGRMPPSGRLALSLALVMLSAALAFVSLMVSGMRYGVAVFTLSIVLIAMLAVAAGFVLSGWRAWGLLTLFDALIVSGLLASWIYVPWAIPELLGGVTGLNAVFGVFFWFAVFILPPLTLAVLTGISLGVLRKQPREQVFRFSALWNWVMRALLALIPVIMAGRAAAMVIYQESNFASNFGGILTSALLATTCLVAGLALRSWWGLLAAPVVYAGIAGLTAFLAAQTASGLGMPLAGLTLNVVLPAVVMSAIGTGHWYGARPARSSSTAAAATNGAASDVVVFGARMERAFVRRWFDAGSTRLSLIAERAGLLYARCTTNCAIGVHYCA